MKTKHGVNFVVPLALLMAFFCVQHLFYAWPGRASGESVQATAEEEEAYRKDEAQYNAAWAAQLVERSADVKDFQRLFPGAEIQPMRVYAGCWRKGDRHVIIVKAEWHPAATGDGGPCCLYLHIPFRVGADRETITMIEPPEELFVEPDKDLPGRRHFREGDWWGVLKSNHGDVAALGRF